MINKVIRKIDKQGRLQLPVDLAKFSNLNEEKNLAMCSMGKSLIKLKKLDELRNHKVIAIIKIDEKNRIVIPPEIREETKIFEIFVFKGDLILKEAPK